MCLEAIIVKWLRFLTVMHEIWFIKCIWFYAGGGGYDHTLEHKPSCRNDDMV